MHKSFYNQKFKTCFSYCLTLHTHRNMQDTVRRCARYVKAPMYQELLQNNLNGSQSHLASSLHNQIKWQQLQNVLSRIKDDIIYVTSWTSGPAFYHIFPIWTHAGQIVTVPLKREMEEINDSPPSPSGEDTSEKEIRDTDGTKICRPLKQSFFYIMPKSIKSVYSLFTLFIHLTRSNLYIHIYYPPY